MKRFLRIGCGGILGAVLLSYSVFQLPAVTVYTVTPGTFVTALASPYPIGGAQVAFLSSPFNSGSIAGTLTSQVISNDTSNPYGGLTFTYLLTASPSSQEISQITVSAFDSLFTDISFNTNSSTLAPSNFSRSSDGAVVRFSFFNPNVFGAQTTALIVVQTGAGAWSPTTAGIIDGQTVNVAALAPFPVPEPATCALMGLALGILTVLRRQRRR